MFIIPIFITILAVVHGHLQLRQNHDYWFNRWIPANNGGNDNSWDYCDYKCLYMETLINNKDFVVVVLTAPLKEKFSACYIKIGKSLILWNSVISNEYYEEVCGKDQKDWANINEFQIQGIYGEGIGTQLT